MTKDFRHGIDWQEAIKGQPHKQWVPLRFDPSDLEQLGSTLGMLISHLEEGDFLAWEAVIREEQSLPLSEAHRNALESLIWLDDEPVHYINESPRPTEPWYDTVRRVVSCLPVETIDTANPEHPVVTEGWHLLVEALEDTGAALSLPEGVNRYLDVVPPDLRQRLFLQGCLDELMGIGDEGCEPGIITLKDEEELERIDDFIGLLRECKDDMQAYGLTLEKILKILVMPPEELEIFVRVFTKALDLESATAPIADHL